MLMLLLIPLVMVVRAKIPVNELHQTLLQSQRQFSADLLQTVAKQNSSQNVIISPTSVYDALLVTYFSAGGKTVATLTKTLRLPDRFVYQDKGRIINDYQMTKWEIKPCSPNTFELNVVNRIYVSDKLKVKDRMVKLLPGEIQQANFTGDTAGALKQINSWVAEQTKNMINNFLKKNMVGPTTEVVLVNAAYFNGTWESPFSNNNTKQDQFHLADGSTAPVTMMSQTSYYRRRYDSQLEADILELPYKGYSLSMFIVLPNKTSASTIPDLLGKLTGETLRNAFEETSKVQKTRVEVHIPKFKAEHEYDLNPVLTTMGAGSLFSGEADFSTLLEKVKDVKISSAIHKATFKVNEEGTEASAATAIITAGSIGPDTENPFRADHPFIYAVYIQGPKLLLFTGIFNSPKQ